MVKQIDPETLFVTEAGELRVWPEHEGKAVIKEAHLETWDLKEKRPLAEPVQVIDKVWYSAKGMPPAVAAAVTRLLEEREALQELLIGFYWYCLYSHQMGDYNRLRELIDRARELEFIRESQPPGKREGNG